MPRSPRINQRLRISIKCNGRCWYCGREPESDARLTMDHARPRSRGGKNQDDNLLPACLYCNNLKESRLVSEFRKFCKVTVIRRALEFGCYGGDLSRIKIVFFGEGNPDPLGF
jgi:hypothetical protein